MNPDNAAAYCRWGDVYAAIGEYVQAMADYNKAIELGVIKRATLFTKVALLDYLLHY